MSSTATVTDSLTRSNIIQYSVFTGLVYIFNLIIGTGALTLPAAFQQAGWLLGVLLLSMLAFMSYLTATFMIESMAAANALLHWKRLQWLKKSGRVSDLLISRSLQTIAESDTERTFEVFDSEFEHASSSSSCIQQIQQRAVNDVEAAECTPLLDNNSALIARIPLSISAYYEIAEIFEMGKMASLFFGKLGQTLFYMCLIIYLYGDLAIYAAAVSKSLRDIICTHVNASATIVSELGFCWMNDETSSFTRIGIYRLCLSFFICILGPFTFCNVSKTKYMQLFTTIMRWLAFGFMISLAIVHIVRNASTTHLSPRMSNFKGVPNLFGVCVYSFMCHHSLPSIVTPISRKRNLTTLLILVYVMILLFYLILSISGVFAFSKLEDLYTLNFQPCIDDPIWLSLIHYFLSLFPVFTLSTNFPIVAITLRNNLQSMFLTERRTYSWCTRRLIFPLLALVPPVCVALITDNLEFLVGITGSYAGAGIQYIFPAFLVYYARRKTDAIIGVGVKNRYASNFRAFGWIVFVQIWAATCVLLVSWDHISNAIV